MTGIDEAIHRLEGLYRTVTGKDAPVSDTPYAAIPPEKDAVRHVEEQLDRLRGVRFEWNDAAKALGHRPGAPDIGVIARERTQSEQRHQQYTRLLDFEKVFALGNSPVILDILERYNIAYIVTANGLSDDVFAHNPLLTAAYRNGEVTVYRLNKHEVTGAGDDPDPSPFLDPLALVNDIGDAEDVFAHLPLSVLAPRVSSVQVDGTRTTRDIESTISALGLNIGLYVPGLWDVDDDGVINTPIDLALIVVGNGARGRLTRGTMVFVDFAVPDDDAPHTIRARIPPGELVTDEQGLAFVTLRLDEGPLRLDRAVARPVR